MDDYEFTAMHDRLMTHKRLSDAQWPEILLRRIERVAVRTEQVKQMIREASMERHPSGRTV